MPHRVWISLIVLTALVLGWSFVRGESGTRQHKTDEQESALMRAKLSSSQKIVEGLVSKDFNVIIRGAEEVLNVCNAEAWEKHHDEVYSHYLKELVRQSEKVILAAERENLDGAAYSYMHVLTTCISCHEYCRDVLKIAGTVGAIKVVPIPTTAEDDGEPVPSRTIRR